MSKSTNPPAVGTQPDYSNLPRVYAHDVDSSVLMKTLYRALSVKRGNGSRTEAEFAGWICSQVPATMIDAAGNIHVDTRTKPSHRTMLTSHLDTVHHSEGANVIISDGKYWRADKGSALGADDGAGVALLCHMIQAGVPGYYVFFRGEECGGLGSSWLAENMPELFIDIDRAVAFDRADYGDVITHQSGGRCCSDEFAVALAAALTTDRDWFLPDSTGVYTDTAEFTSLVAECTNCSVGYKNQHGDREWLDVEFLQRLAKIVVSFDWDALPVVRNPSVQRAYAQAGVYTGIDWGTDDEDGAEECEVLNAIELAYGEGDFSWLMNLMAASVYIEDPGAAYQMINETKLAKELDDAYDMIDRGMPAAQVLLHLFDSSAT